MRIVTCGFEKNTLRNNEEVGSITTSNSITDSVVRSGRYAFKPSSPIASTAKYCNFKFDETPNNSGTFFTRVYLLIETLPDAISVIYTIDNTNPGGADAELRLNTDGTITPKLGTSVLASSFVLGLNIWYRLEIFMDFAPASGARRGSFLIDGNIIASSNTLSTSITHNAVSIGSNLNANGNTATSGQWYFDDVAINNNFGDINNSFPGPGKIFLKKSLPNNLRTKIFLDRINTINSTENYVMGTNIIKLFKDLIEIKENFNYYAPSSRFTFFSAPVKGSAVYPPYKSIPPLRSTFYP